MKNKERKVHWNQQQCQIQIKSKERKVHWNQQQCQIQIKGKERKVHWNQQQCQIQKIYTLLSPFVSIQLSVYMR